MGSKELFSASWEITLFCHVIMAALFIFIYFWLHWVFVAAHRLPLVAAHSFLITVASHGRAR